MNLPARVALSDTSCRPQPPDHAVDARYRITTEVDADVLCRVLNLFALQGQVPQEVQALRHDEGLEIHLRVTTVPRHRAELAAQRMRSMVSICQVELQIRDGQPVLSAI